MHRRLLLGVVTVAVLTSGGSAAADGDAGSAFDAACTRPGWSGELPEPASATREQMLSAQAAVRAFDADVARYGECLAAMEARLVAEGQDRTQVLAARAARNDGSINDAELLAIAFNTALRVWRGQPPPVVTPPEIIDAGGMADRKGCLREDAATIARQVTEPVLLTVRIDGSAAVDNWPEGLPDGYRSMVECLLPLLRFAPAAHDSQPVLSRVRMPHTLLGPSNTQPPTLVDAGSQAARDRCMPDQLLEPPTEIRAAIILRIDVDGRATVAEWPAGTSDGYRRAVECVLPQLRFSPGTRDGRPVVSHGKLPLTILQSGSPSGQKWQSPAAISTPESRASVLKECTPEGFAGRGNVVVAVEVRPSGRVARVRVEETSGDATIDEIAACMARRTTFSPGRVEGVASTMTVMMRYVLGL